MFKNLKTIGISIICFAVGVVMLSTSITDPEIALGGRIAGVLFACLFILFAFIFYFSNSAKRAANRREWKDRNNIFALYETLEDHGSADRLLSDFREDYSGFFAARGVEANSALQQASTQLFWNITALKKKRLDARGITEEFYSERKAYTDIEGVSSRNYFDGRYDVTEFNESLASRVKYQRDGNTLLCKTDRRIAHYVMTDVKVQGEKLVLCPNCGAETTRENLVDGCDYCGTKFLVEDLREKITAFRLRSNYQMQYEKYRLARSRYSEKVFALQFIVWVLFALIAYVIELSGHGGETASSSGSFVADIFAAILASAFFAGCMAFLGSVVFWAFIFPFIQVKASVQYISKRYLEEMKQREQLDNEYEKMIKDYDPLFSIQAFYSNLHNKLATIHFGDTRGAVAAFFDEGSESAAEKLQGKYSDVIDMDMEDISVEGFKVENGLQQVSVKILLTLVRDQDKTVKSEKELVHMKLVRLADAKTMALCGPTIFTCKKCGAGLALETGKTCPHCGNTIDFKIIDWAIVEYN